MAMIIYIAMQSLREPDSSLHGRGQAVLGADWIANTVPVFNGSTKGIERQTTTQ